MVLLFIIISQSCSITLKGTAVDESKYLGKIHNNVSIYSNSPTGQVFVPFYLSSINIDRLLLIEIKDDPFYKMLELQIIEGRPVILSKEKDGSTIKYVSPEAQAGAAFHKAIQIINNVKIEFGGN